MARDFAGFPDRIVVPKSNSISEDVKSEHTVACWFKRDGAQPTYANVLSLSYDSGSGTVRITYMFQSNGSSDTAYRYVSQNATDSYVFAGPGSFSASSDTWYFIAGTYKKNADVRFYYGGIGDALTEVVGNTTSDVDAYTHASQQLDIGALKIGGSHTRYLDGQVAHIGLWNVRLTQAELEQFKRGRIPRPGNLKLFMPLYGASPEVDYSGNKNNSSSITGTTVVDHPPVIAPFAFDPQAGLYTIAAAKTGRITATQANLTYDAKTGRLTAVQADLTFDLKEARVTATQADLVFDPKTARLTATQGDLVYDPKEARITATQADLVFDVKEARLTATQADLTFDLKEARVTATQADLVFDPKTARLTATQGDLVFDPKEARLTATQADLVFDPKEARITATQADLEYDLDLTARITATQADLTYDAKTARLTATQADLVFDPKEARLIATQADLVFDLKEARLTAAQVDLEYDAKTARLTATQADLTFDPKTARLVATQADLVYVEAGASEARITAVQADLTYDEVRAALPPRAPMPYPLVGRRRVGLV